MKQWLISRVPERLGGCTNGEALLLTLILAAVIIFGLAMILRDIRVVKARAKRANVLRLGRKPIVKGGIIYKWR